MSEEKKRDAAIRQAKNNAHAAWFARASQLVVWFARYHDEFNSTDVLRAIGDEFTTHEKRAIGGVFTSAARDKYIENTLRTVKKGSHARPITVWRSLLRKKTPAPLDPKLCPGEPPALPTIAYRVLDTLENSSIQFNRSFSRKKGWQVIHTCTHEEARHLGDVVKAQAYANERSRQLDRERQQGTQP